MILSDGTLRAMLASGALELSPLDADQIQPASVDVTLGADFIVFERPGVICDVDPSDRSTLRSREVTITEGDQFRLAPGDFALGTTVETVGMPHDLVSRAEGKSSLARLGLLIHITAGFIDPGFRGQITLELHNVAPHALMLTPGMKIGQLSFERLDRPAERPYGSPGLGSRYQGQIGTTGSRYGQKQVRQTA